MIQAPTTSLVESASQQEVLTSRGVTDCRTAVARGLAEYMASLSFDAEGGRSLLFNKVEETWAEPAEPADYPAAVVYTPGEGSYDFNSFTPTMSLKNKVGDDLYLLKHSEFTIDLFLEIWANDPEARLDLTLAAERALAPVDFMAGFKLDLPHYFGSRAVYLKKASSYQDTEENVMRGYRIARFVVAAQLSEYTLISKPIARTRVVTTVT